MKALLSQIEPVVSLSREGDILSYENPMKAIIADDLAVPVGNGLFVLKGQLAQLLKLIDNVFVSVAEEEFAEEIWVPSLLSVENTTSSQYLASFWDQALMLRKNGDTVGPNFGTGDLVAMACPTACHHYFSSLKGKKVSRSHLVTTLAKCTRFEKGNLPDLSRLTNFSMREIVGIGTANECTQAMARIQTRVLDLYDSLFDLSYELSTASDPFFGSDQEIKKKAQLMSQSKHEVLARLPYSQGQLAITSFNQHGNTFFGRFQIGVESKEWDRSFCVAFGYERILHAILSQKGTDFGSAYYSRLFSKLGDK